MNQSTPIEVTEILDYDWEGDEATIIIDEYGNIAVYDNRGRAE